MLPSLADHYLAHVGYDAQQHDGWEDPNRPNNLYEPVAGDHGAHGSFDDQAHERSLELWGETHALWLAAAAGLGFASAFAGGLLNRRKRLSFGRLAEHLGVLAH